MRQAFTHILTGRMLIDGDHCTIWIEVGTDQGPSQCGRVSILGIQVSAADHCRSHAVSSSTFSMNGFQVVAVACIELDVECGPLAVHKEVRAFIFGDAAASHRVPRTRTGPTCFLGNPELVDWVFIGAQVKIGGVITVGEENVVPIFGWHEITHQLISVIIATFVGPIWTILPVGLQGHKRGIVRESWIVLETIEST